MKPKHDQKLHDFQAMLATRAARRKRDEDIARARRAETLCAWRFLTSPEPHKCELRGVPCSRDYNPYDVREGRPEDENLYVGTAIGFLYGLEGCERFAWQTAGWNIKRRRRRS